MAEILKEWLTNRLHTPIQWKAEEFGEKMKNGYIVACILNNYNIINDEKHYLIRSSNLNEDIKNNWNLLKEWLRDIEINLDEEDLKNIKGGKGSTILRLYYQLYLHLDKKDRTDFIKAERKMASTLVDKFGHRFSIHKVVEKEESEAESLSKPLLNQKIFIEWQKRKSKEIKETYDYIRHKYSKKLRKAENLQTPLCTMPKRPVKLPDADKKDMRKFGLKYPCKFENYSYEELLDMEVKNLNKNTYIVDSEWTKDYMDNLYNRMHKKEDSEEFQKQVMHVVSGSLWNSSIAEVESKVDLDLAKKVMKLSQFEKQMCTQIMETKQQARNLVNNRIIAEKEFLNERTQKFNIYLDTLREDITSGLTEIDFEKHRQEVLHKKLYAEKMKRKRQHYYDICYDTMLSIVDYATKYAYFRRLLGDEIPYYLIHEWKLLYYKQQPIFDILEPLDDLIVNDVEEEEAEVEEVIDLNLERLRQDTLNECEFIEYLSYITPWALHLLIPNYEPESEDRKYENLGKRILGHVVYSLLEIKYPYPPVKMPAELPEFTAKALLNFLPDMSITVAMQKLLDAQKIHVVRIESCVNFCLRQYKLEMIGCIDIELTFDKFITNAQEENSKELIKLMKSEDELINKSNELNMAPLNINTKQTQTPKTLPEDEIVLSNAASFGQYAYELLTSGDSLTTPLIVGMIIEYLKDQEDINGFVIINYPNNYMEAQALEDAFSGRCPPDEIDLEDDDDVFLEENISKRCKIEDDPFIEIRKSKLVNNPHKLLSEQPFVSYFTCYIKLKETEDILQEFFIWDLNKENSEFIDRFYSTLGINYSMYYEIIEKDQLALICQYIIGDNETPFKSYDTLFGEHVLSTLDFPTFDTKRTKSKTIKPLTSNNKLKDGIQGNSKASQMSATSGLEIVHGRDSGEDVKDSETSLSKVLENSSLMLQPSIEEIILLAGEEDWEYGKLPIPEQIGISLATYWEEFEKVYTTDIKQLLLTKRLQMNCLIPYTTFIKDKMEQIITLPSRKQDLVCNFQREYNNFENDWRDIHVTKDEWHCRVKSLKRVLYNICDERKKYAEHQKHLLICENWAIDELVTLANIYISLMQTELNRTFLTYQILHDFYFAMIKRMPPTDRLTSKELMKLLKETDETSGSKKGGEDKLYRQLKNAYLDLQLRNIELDNTNNPLNLVIENNVKFVIKTAKDLNDSYRSLISREYSEIAKMAPAIKKKDENNSESSIDSIEIFKDNALRCIDEWTMGINGEMFRSNLRILVLQSKCFEDMKLFSNHVFKTFAEIQNSINKYYLNEIKSVNRLCKYLQMAVEEGKKIPENLLLQDDRFIIDPSLLHFSESIDHVEETIGESSSYVDFKIGQLAKLRNTFKILAPTGIALQKKFIFALQDFIFFGKESCNGPIFPASWKRIDPEEIPKLVFLIYGETAFVDWRDFLIYCLNIRFPSVDELLEVRKKLRCVDLESKEVVDRDNYMDIEFWFENDFDLDDKHLRLRNTLTKHFLFELFETNENMMNYSAFLLAFCKSIDPKEGFSKALAVAEGKKLCYLQEECDEAIQKLIAEKKYRDECRFCALKCATQFLDKMIENVVATCESTTIIELEYVEPPDKDKKGKGKAKAAAKGKKIENSQSARLSKTQKSLLIRSKTVQSETDVKKTFICKPCEEEPDTLDKLDETEVLEEDLKEEPLIDPDLQYAVQQSTIWNILRLCLPGHFNLIPADQNDIYVTQVKELLTCLEQDTDDKSIYVSKFLSDSNICKILNKTKKFFILDLQKEILKVST